MNRAAFRCLAIVVTVAVVKPQMCGCRALEPRSQPAPAPTKQPGKPTAIGQIGTQALDVINPRTYIGTKEIAEAAQSFRDKVNEIDVARFNELIQRSDSVLDAVRDGVKRTTDDSIKPLADHWREPPQRLSENLDLLKEKIAAFEVSRINQAVTSSERASESFARAADELQALVADFRELLAEIDPAEITTTIHNVRSSSRHLEATAARLPSTSASLSTTIWLLNALLAVGITLGIVRLLQGRSRDTLPKRSSG